MKILAALRKLFLASESLQFDSLNAFLHHTIWFDLGTIKCHKKFERIMKGALRIAGCDAE
jgi:hypothetical protein